MTPEAPQRPDIRAAAANERGALLAELRRDHEAVEAFREACILAPRWPVAWLNLANALWRSREWQRALEAALTSIELEPLLPGAYRAAGLAATALGEWTCARWAWEACGWQLPAGDGPVVGDLGMAAIRLKADVDESANVWCRRLDPVRGRLLGVPRPEARRRHGDVVLHEPEPVGSHCRRGTAYPLFEEIIIFERSSYRTWAIDAVVPSAVDFDELRSRCLEANRRMEDWTVRGGAAVGTPPPWQTARRFGMAVLDDRELDLLATWASARDDRIIRAATMVL